MEEIDREFRFILLHSSSFPFQKANVIVDPGQGIVCGEWSGGVRSYGI